MGRRGLATLCALGVVITACSDDDAADTSPAASATPTTQGPATTPAAPTTSPPVTPTAAPTTVAATTVAPATTIGGPAGDELVEAIRDDVATSAVGCDPLDPRHCYLPFPSNGYTVLDADSPTGRRVAFPLDAAPTNSSGVLMDVSEWNRNDGFSANTTILTFVADLDAEASDLPSWTDLEASLADDATVVLVDIDTGERIPLWAEPDSSAADDGDRALVIHPARSLPEGHTFAVGLRGLVTTAGETVEPAPAFVAFRDALTTGLPEIENRRADMDIALDALEATGVARGELQLAWDFTVASTEGTTGRMLHVRDETLSELGESAPAFTITSMTDDPAVDPADDGQPIDGIARLVTGTFSVTNWLTGDGSAGHGFNYEGSRPSTSDALPVANGELDVSFACHIPDAVIDGIAAGHMVQYGHGLLGSEMEVDAANLREFANAHLAVVCATKWAGMSEDDIGNAAASLGDFSNFPTLTDRLQQGVLNQLVLSRLLLGEHGLTSDPAFQRADGSPLMDRATLYYDGNSQGGIMGLMLAGVSQDIERFVLGVPGMNYGMLLPRSVDFDTYETIFQPAYPNDLDRTLILAMIQMLWDRGEGAGYATHVTADPLPDTPIKDVLLHVAFGDHQVSEITAMIEARALGIPIHRPVAADGRSREVEPGWDLATLSYPSDGSAIIVWDSGAARIPVIPEPPRRGRDPHGDPRSDPDAQRQKAEFLFEGRLVDVCDGAACPADPDD